MVILVYIFRNDLLSLFGVEGKPASGKWNEPPHLLDFLANFLVCFPFPVGYIIDT